MFRPSVSVALLLEKYMDQIRPNLSFVIACYNSQETLAGVVDEIIATLDAKPSIDYEIILVNDYSKDALFSVIERLCYDNSKIKGIHLSRNFGQQAAMLAAS